MNLTVQKGEVVTISGASGAGKTSLLQILGTLEKPDKKPTHHLEINGTDLSKLSDKKLSVFRNQNIGFVFQFHQLLPEFTALENICIPAFIAKKNKIETEKKALKILKTLDLGHRAQHKPNQLSGGEQQRIAVGRAIINDPLVIFADEPSGNLDSKNAEKLHCLFLRLRDEFNQTFVIVTHNEKLSEMGDRKIIMRDGNII